MAGSTLGRRGLIGRLGPPGPGRTLAAAYAIFALAAGARSLAQIATDLGAAPLAYLLSAVAACVYLTLAATINRRDRRLVALAACCFELAGVLAVGAASLAFADAFPDQTVWSGFGEGYGFLPVMLPVLGFSWLRRRRPAPAAVS